MKVALTAEYLVAMTAASMVGRMDALKVDSKAVTWVASKAGSMVVKWVVKTAALKVLMMAGGRAVMTAALKVERLVPTMVDLMAV